MLAIIAWYVKKKGSKICQDSSHLPMELSYVYKSQDNIGWYNLIKGGIDLHYNPFQTDYLKEGTSRNMGIKRERYFIFKNLQMPHEQRLYVNVVVHERGEYGILQMELTILKSKIRLQMDIGSRVVILEHNNLFNQR